MYLISNFVKIVLNTFPLSIPVFFSWTLFLIYYISICVVLPFGEAAAGYFEGHIPVTRHVESECINMWYYSWNVRTLSWLQPWNVQNFQAWCCAISCYHKRLSVIKLSAFLLSVFVWNLPNTGSDSPLACSVNAWKTSIYVVFCQHRGALCHVRDH